MAVGHSNTTSQWLTPAASSTPRVTLQAGQRYPFQAMIPVAPGADPNLQQLVEQEVSSGAVGPLNLVGERPGAMLTSQGALVGAWHRVCWRWLAAPWDGGCGESRGARSRVFRYVFHLYGPALGMVQSVDLEVEWRLAWGRGVAGVVVWVAPVAAGVALFMGHPHVTWALGKVALLADQYAGFERVTFKPEDLPDLLDRAIGADREQPTNEVFVSAVALVRHLVRAWSIADDHMELPSDVVARLRGEVEEMRLQIGRLRGHEGELAAALQSVGRVAAEPVTMDRLPPGVELTEAEARAAAVLLEAVSSGDAQLERILEAVDLAGGGLG